MPNPLRDKPRGNLSRTVIIKHDGKSESTMRIRGDVIDLSTTRQSFTQQATFRGFKSPPGRF